MMATVRTRVYTCLLSIILKQGTTYGTHQTNHLRHSNRNRDVNTELVAEKLARETDIEKAIDEGVKA